MSTTKSRTEAIETIQELEKLYDMTSEQFQSNDWPIGTVDNFHAIEWEFRLDQLRTFNEREERNEQAISSPS